MEGLVVMLPPGYEQGDVLSPEEVSNLAVLERVLTTTRVKFPVYFAVENDALQALVASYARHKSAAKWHALVPDAATGLAG